MPSLTYLRNATTTVAQVFGSAKDRTAWSIYNADTTINVYWGNNRGNIYSMFVIPPQSVVGLKIPEDDPTQEVWIISSSGAPQVYVYEGFNKELMERYK